MLKVAQLFTYFFTSNATKGEIELEEVRSNFKSIRNGELNNRGGTTRDVEIYERMIAFLYKIIITLVFLIGSSDTIPYESKYHRLSIRSKSKQ